MVRPFKKKDPAYAQVTKIYHTSIQILYKTCNLTYKKAVLCILLQTVILYSKTLLTLTFLSTMLSLDQVMKVLKSAKLKVIEAKT